MTLTEHIQQRLSQLTPEKQNEVLDFITFLHEQARRPTQLSSEEKRKERLRQAFETLAELGTFAYITDPIEWQRQLRSDRPLPGRSA